MARISAHIAVRRWQTDRSCEPRSRYMRKGSGRWLRSESANGVSVSMSGDPTVKVTAHLIEEQHGSEHRRVQRVKSLDECVAVDSIW